MKVMTNTDMVTEDGRSEDGGSDVDEKEHGGVD